MDEKEKLAYNYSESIQKNRGCSVLSLQEFLKTTTPNSPFSSSPDLLPENSSSSSTNSSLKNSSFFRFIKGQQKKRFPNKRNDLNQLQSVNPETSSITKDHFTIMNPDLSPSLHSSSSSQIDSTHSSPGISSNVPSISDSSTLTLNSSYATQNSNNPPPWIEISQNSLHPSSFNNSSDKPYFRDSVSSEDIYNRDWKYGEETNVRKINPSQFTRFKCIGRPFLENSSSLEDNNNPVNNFTPMAEEDGEEKEFPENRLEVERNTAYNRFVGMMNPNIPSKDSFADKQRKEQKHNMVQFSQVVELISNSPRNPNENETSDDEEDSFYEMNDMETQTVDSSFTPKKRVRHVQVQTRKPGRRTVGIQYNATPLESTHPPNPPSELSVDEEVISSTIDSLDELSPVAVPDFPLQPHSPPIRSSSLSSTGETVSSTSTANETIHYRNQSQHLARELDTCKQLLLEEMNLTEQLREVMQEQRNKFDHISAAAYAKLKKLLSEKQQLQVEVAKLRAQLESISIDQQWEVHGIESSTTKPS